MPVSRQEGISLFEMEILLTVRQRTQNRRPTLLNQVCNGIYFIFCLLCKG